MILAAGRGQRMRPITDHTPKPLLRIGGKSLIDYHLERLAQAGLSDVVINVCWLRERIQAHVGNGSAYGLNVEYSVEAEALETAGGIIQALPLLGDGEFLLLNADVYCSNPLPQLLSHPLGKHLAKLLLTPRPDYLAGDFGLQDQLVQHKRADQDSPLYTYCGLGRYSIDIFRNLEPGSRPLRPLLEQAIEEQRLAGEILRGSWLDVGTPERLLRANQDFGEAPSA